MICGIVFPFGISVYLLCIVLQIILGARKGYLGASIIVAMYLIGGLAFCLSTRTLHDYYLSVILAAIQCVAFVASMLFTNSEKHNRR